MNEELIKYLDERFDRVEESIEKKKIDVGVNKTNILVGFKGAKEERATVKAKIDETYNAVIDLLKRFSSVSE